MTNEMTAAECLKRIEKLKFNNASELHALLYSTSILRKVESGELRKVVHGEWAKKYDSGSQNYNSDENWYYVCSECGGWDKHPEKYCHCCGALMDGKDDSNA